MYPCHLLWTCAIAPATFHSRCYNQCTYHGSGLLSAYSVGISLYNLSDGRTGLSNGTVKLDPCCTVFTGPLSTCIRSTTCLTIPVTGPMTSTSSPTFSFPLSSLNSATFSFG